MAKSVKLQEVAIDLLKPYERNAKVHPKEQVERIVKSIKEFGFVTPCVIDSDYNLIVGHGRVQAAKEIGIETVPCVFVEGLTEAQRKAYILADNRLGELGEWNMDIVFGELEDLQAMDFDIDVTGFEMPEEIPEVFEDDFEPVVPTEPRTKLGDLWKLGNHRLICGDSTDPAVIDRLMDGAKADMVFTDPPYGMNLDTDWSGAKSNRKFYKEKGCKGQGNKYDKVIGDNDDFKEDLIKTIFNNFGYCKEIFVWGADYYPELLQGYKDGNMFVWDKRSNEDTKDEYVEKSDKMYGSQFELCWSKNKHRKQIARVKWAGIFGTEKEFDKKRVHPTQKPSALVGWFLERYSKESQAVIDLFGGSGSTLIACEQLNRKCYMCEFDPHYCDVIISRWETLTGREAVLLDE